MDILNLSLTGFVRHWWLFVIANPDSDRGCGNLSSPRLRGIAEPVSSKTRDLFLAMTEGVSVISKYSEKSSCTQHPSIKKMKIKSFKIQWKL